MNACAVQLVYMSFTHSFGIGYATFLITERKKKMSVLIYNEHVQEVRSINEKVY